MGNDYYLSGEMLPCTGVSN